MLFCKQDNVLTWNLVPKYKQASKNKIIIHRLTCLKPCGGDDVEIMERQKSLQ